ncbi:MAG TPA: hypothetical protein V6C95_19715 [Coleofasciculaceae cyanobacterium]
MSLVLLFSGMGVFKWETYFGFSGQTHTVGGIAPDNSSTVPSVDQHPYKFSSFVLIER